MIHIVLNDYAADNDPPVVILNRRNYDEGHKTLAGREPEALLISDRVTLLKLIRDYLADDQNIAVIGADARSTPDRLERLERAFEYCLEHLQCLCDSAGASKAAHDDACPVAIASNIAAGRRER